MTGAGADRYELARNMSEAWVAFARSGNPNHQRHPSLEPLEPDALADDGLQPRNGRRQ